MLRISSVFDARFKLRSHYSPQVTTIYLFNKSVTICKKKNSGRHLSVLME